MQENKYIGDEKMIKFLEHYSCSTPLEVIKMRFVGAICSPNLELRPSDIISSFWPKNQTPRLETKPEADLFFKFFMGLWDELFEKVKTNKISLDPLLMSNLHYYCERRFAEIEQGFVEGFWGGKQDVKIPSYLAELIDHISELAGTYQTLARKLDNGANSDEIAPILPSCDATVTKAIAFVIENSVLPRIENLTRVVN